MFIIKSRAGGKCLFSSLQLEFASVIWAALGAGSWTHSEEWF